MSALYPDARLQFDPAALRLHELPRSFYLQGTASVARRLIGKWFARFHDGHWYGARITETEAYLGRDDAAAHSFRGRRTARVEPMYMEGGHLYVFFVYGMHHCANIVTRQAGIAEAVLLRAAEGPPGAPDKLLSGPARFCAALGITLTMTGADLLAGGDVRVFGRRRGNPVEIGTAPRIGVDYAGEASSWLLRYFDLHSASVSGAKGLRKISKI